MDLHGKPFVQHARTVNASTVGARLIGIDCVREGEVISLQHGEQKSRCKVIWVGRDAAKARQIGIFCLEPGKTLFGAVLHTSRTPTGYAPGFAGRKETARPPDKARSIMQDTPGTRRSQERFHCTGGVELRRNEGAPPVFGNLSDLSLTGCYVETVSTLPVGTELLFMLRVRESVVRGRAQVKTSHHAVGVGLVFQHMSKEDRQNLEFVIGSLSGLQEMRPPDQRRPVQEDPLPLHRALSGNTVRPASASGSSSPISVQVTGIMNELNKVEQGLVIDRVDPRIIAQFHDAVEHIRQTAWSVVQWVELNSRGGDPFEVLPQLEAERMHMLRKLAHNVTADVDAGSITRFTDGISEMYEVAQGLYRGLRKIVIDSPDDK
ncbi:MAG TPA: PilZ domain-containing protein [Candidatus Angelobacter sp.]|nr:PilZ domain-containing protein [Candidatus Angelobacter sp.]